MKSTFALSLTAGATLVLFIFLLANPVRIVDSGNVGVVYRFGKVSTEVLQPGFNLVTPTCYYSQTFRCKNTSCT